MDTVAIIVTVALAALLVIDLDDRPRTHYVTAP
jgi:hypothetical protein